MDDITQIVLPDGSHYDPLAAAVDRAAREYDENLRFGYNEQNGDWVLYIRMPRDFESYYRIEGDPVYPVLGFGKSIPSPDVALKRLYEADTLRHGLEKLDRMNRENEKIKEAAQAEFEDMQDDRQERLQFALQKAGWDGPVKVFFASKRG